MGGSGEDVGRVIVEILDLPAGDLLASSHAAGLLVAVRGAGVWQAEGSAREEECGEEGDHLVSWCLVDV